MPNFKKILYPYSNKWFCSFNRGNIIIGKILRHEPDIKNTGYIEVFSVKIVYGLYYDKFIKNKNIKETSFYIKYKQDIIDRPKRENYNYILIKNYLMYKFLKNKETIMPVLNENYWNNKWEKAPIIYGGRVLRTGTKRIGIDVKNFIVTNDVILQDIIKRYNLKKGNMDDTALAIQRWVVRFLTYKYDDDLHKTPEYWQFPFETTSSKHGDCEDGAILITSLMINAGIPSWRAKVAAGMVQSSPTAPEGGHAYSLYLAEDANWRIIDWCYAEDSRVRVKDKPLAREGGPLNAYKEVWFTFNNEYSWNQKSLTLGARIANDKAENSSNSLEESLVSDVNESLIMEDIEKSVGDFE